MFDTLYNKALYNADRAKAVIDKFGQLIALPIVGNLYDLLYYSKIHRKIAFSTPMPRTIRIESLNICNLKCTMCPYPIMTRKKEKMSLSLFKKIVDDAVESGFTSLNLFAWGEPLLDNLIFERVKYAKERGLTVGFDSNGTLLTADKIRQIVEEGLDQISFSIDGATKQVYERIRIGANFESTISNIKDLLKFREENNAKKPLIEITSVTQRENSKDLHQLRQILRGADRFHIQLVSNLATAELSKGSRVQPKLRHLYPCLALWSEFVVLSNGKVTLCCWDYDGSLDLGDLATSTIAAVWNSKKFKEIRQLHLKGEADKIELCRDCELLYRQHLAWWVE